MDERAPVATYPHWQAVALLPEAERHQQIREYLDAAARTHCPELYALVQQQREGVMGMGRKKGGGKKC